MRFSFTALRQKLLPLWCVLWMLVCLDSSYGASLCFQLMRAFFSFQFGSRSGYVFLIRTTSEPWLNRLALSSLSRFRSSYLFAYWTVQRSYPLCREWCPLSVVCTYWVIKSFPLLLGFFLSLPSLPASAWFLFWILLTCLSGAIRFVSRDLLLGWQRGSARCAFACCHIWSWCSRCSISSSFALRGSSHTFGFC